MKWILAVTLFLPSISMAQEFHFVYIFGRDKLEYKVQAKDLYQALEKGADFCNTYYVKREASFDEGRRLDIIDTCANPGQKKANDNDL